MIKFRHVLHPIRTTASAMSLLAIYRHMSALVSENQSRLLKDSRCDLQNVVRGAVRSDPPAHDDTALLERICIAYARATRDATRAAPAYRATAWWEMMRATALEPVRRALATRNIDALRVMYRNFYRDPCSAGLVGAALHMSNHAHPARFRLLSQQWFLVDALHRLDYWKQQTGGQYCASALAVPSVGNPYGLYLDGCLIGRRAEYHHYCANRISGLLTDAETVVLDIGGGFGAMAYYLLRDRSAFHYADFDVPESLALTAYYLLSARPALNVLLYGEADLMEDSLIKFDAILMPTFELPRLAGKSADLTFSSHAMSDLSPEAASEYINEIERTTRQYFLYMGDVENTCLPEAVARQSTKLRLIEQRLLDWNRMQFAGKQELELLYQVSEG